MTGLRRQAQVEVQRPIRAKLTAQPRFQLPAISCDPVWMGFSTATTAAPLSTISSFLAAPTASPTKNTKISQSTDERWNSRRLDSIDLESPVTGVLVLSARHNWVLMGNEVKVLGTSLVMDGARRAEALLRTDADRVVPLLVVFGMGPDDENAFREALGTTVLTSEPIQQKFDTETPRLAVSDRWITVTIESEPFVVPTARGYAPALLVRREANPYSEHLLVGAKSLAQQLESARPTGGCLSGLRLRLRK